MNEIVFTTECPADVAPEFAKEHNIGLIPLHVNLDGKDFYENDPTISNQFIYDTYQEKKILPSTSAVSIGEYKAFFKPYLDEGKTVIHLSISTGISSTYQNACIAKEQLDADGKLYVLDSKCLSSCLCVLLAKGVSMAEAGMPADKIAAEILDMVPRVDKSFIICSLEFLRHGGRCSAVEAFGANLLKLKPVIDMDADGVMYVAKKFRGKEPAVYLDYMDDRLDGVDYDDEYAFVSGCLIPPEHFKAVTDHLKSKYHFQHIITNDTGCVITSHGGKGAIGIWFLRRPAL